VVAFSVLVAVVGFVSFHRVERRFVDYL
jgi:hypothetical protein